MPIECAEVFFRRLTLMPGFNFFSKRQRITLRLLYAIAIPSVVCRMVVCLSVCLSSVVCDVGAPYSGG